jgi:hypothetical protein
VEIGSAKFTHVSLAKRIGRRKEDSEGKVTRISQSEWEAEQQNAQDAEDGKRPFAFCFDDSGKKKKIEITSPVLLAAIKKVIPLTCFESTEDSVSFDQPYAPLFQFWGSIRTELKEHIAESTEPDDFNALWIFP